MRKILTLVNRDDAPPLLSAPLEKLYGSNIGFPEPSSERPYVAINFVKTLDGFISFNLPGREYAQYISNHNQEDAFLMGMLRALADAVMEGATHIIRFPDHNLTPARIDPVHTKSFVALRKKLIKRAQPLHVFLTRSGRVMADMPAKSIEAIPAVFRTKGLQSLVITTEPGVARLREAFHGYEAFLPESYAAGQQDIDLRSAMRYLRQQHHVRLLVIEGGPRLTGTLVASQLYDEWFLTIAPQIIGSLEQPSRPTLAQGIALNPETALWHRLISVKMADDYLFERYRVIAK